MRGFVASRGDYFVHQQIRSHFEAAIRSRILAGENRIFAKVLAFFDSDT